jgi:hypothetical protein
VPHKTFRRLQIAELVFGHSKHMESVEVAWLSFQDFDVTGLRLGEIPGMVERARPGEHVSDIDIVLSGWVRMKLRLMVHPAVALWCVVATSRA